MSEQRTTATRLEANLKLAAPIFDLQGFDRAAAWYLFSMLSHLEEVAVLAAKRGDGIEGQLDDEIVHRDTFATIAGYFYGGLAPRSKPVTELLDFLGELRGPTSLACLNVVAESWLENIFHHIRASHDAFFRLFDGIEAEEARHAHEARELPVPEKLDSEPVVRALERRLWAVSVDPYFVIPLHYFLGQARLSRLARENRVRHREALRHLGLEEGPYAAEVGLCGRQAAAVEPADPAPLGPWRETAFDAELPPISQLLDVQLPAAYGPAELEARVVQALGWVLEENPADLNLTLHPGRPGTLWRPRDAVVAVRREWRPGLVMTLYMDNPHCNIYEAYRSRVTKRAARARALPYLPARRLSVDLEALAPAPTAAASVTSTGVFGIERGIPSLSPREGCTIAINVGAIRPDNTVTLGIVVDHRVHNGRELGLIGTELRRHLE